MIYGGPKVFVRLASQWNSLMMMMMIQHIQSATQSNNGITHTHTHFHAGQQQPSLSPRCRLPETDGAKSCQQSDQVGLYLVGIHQMAPPEHTSDKRAYYSLYVCKEHLCSRRTLQPRLSQWRYGQCIIVLERTEQILVARRTVSEIATCHELSVEVSSKEPDRNRWNFFVHIVLSYSTRWRDCLALLNANDSVWRLLRQGYITRRGRWVLTDVDTCIPRL